MMSFFVRVKRTAACQVWAWAAVFIFAAAFSGFSQTNYYATNGIEYPIIGQLPGDQMYPNAALSTSGGYIVWQDNITDGSGLGISAMQLDDTASSVGSTFRVNVIGANNQENPRVTLLKQGGAAFVWQGGQEGYQHIYARFLNSSNLWLNSTDVVVNTFTNNFQITPAIATLADGNVIVVWGSYDEAGSNSLQDVYGQILSPSGAKVGGEFLVNQFTPYNQRTPAVAALTNGGFIVTWVSEQERVPAPLLGNNTSTNDYTSQTGIVTPSVDVYARSFDSNAVAASGEILVDATGSFPCAKPEVAVASDGSCLITWCAFNTVMTSNSWDIYGSILTNGVAISSPFYINSTIPGDQYVPQVGVIGQDYLVTWTSLGQDGSREGVYAQFVHDNGTLIGSEFRVNTTTANQQMQPTVASDGQDQFLVAWAGYDIADNNFDLYAQRYMSASGILLALPAPYVWAPFTLNGSNIYQPQLVVTWPPVVGLSVSNYEVYMNGATTPIALVSSNEWIMTAANGLGTNSTKSFQVDYVLTDGRRSPISASGSGATWSGLNWGGIPYEWMAEYFGGYASGKYTTTFWLSPTVNLGGGTTLYQVFLSGGSPLDPSTWLQTSLTQTPQGGFLSWNTQPGATYQVVATGNFLTWTNVGSPRFANGTNDSIYVGGASAGYYRVMLMR